jgi:predicted sulfurtransferase
LRGKQFCHTAPGVSAGKGLLVIKAWKAMPSRVGDYCPNILSNISYIVPSSSEKATSYLRQSLDTHGGAKPANVLMLEGGIHNYLEWIKQENDPKESLWLGKNYVFDARQSLGLEDPSSQSPAESDRLVSFCQGCNTASARYVKCDGFGCHRLIIACDNCSPTMPTGKSGMCCCIDCKEMGERVLEYVDSARVLEPGETRVKRGICSCERARRIALGVEEK